MPSHTSISTAPLGMFLSSFFWVARSKDIRSEDIYKMFAIITIRLYYRALSEVNRIVQEVEEAFPIMNREYFLLLLVTE